MIDLPQCTDVERFVLGAVMARSEHIDEARGFLDGPDFLLEKHRRIWSRICELYDAGKPVDRITVYQALSDHRESEAVGGLSYLVELDAGIPDSPALGAYMDRLRESSLRRKMMLAAQKLAIRAADECENPQDVLSGFAEVETQLSQVSDSRRPISTHDMIVQEGVSALLEPRSHGAIKLPWPRLDEALAGLSAGQMIVLMAGTSKGKTSMALQVAAHAALHGHTPAIWTMEMPPRALFRRLVSQIGGVPAGQRRLEFSQRNSQADAITQLGGYPIFMDNRSDKVSLFVASLRQIRTRAKLGLAVVDYIQLIGRGNIEQRAQEVSANSRAMKQAAMDFGIPVLVLSQVDRGSVKGEGKIGIHSAKNSGDIENDADVVLWIDAPAELPRDQPSTVSLVVGKQREGPAGFSIPMIWNPVTQTFLEVAE